MPTIRSVTVRKLLGEFDHRIRFPEEWDYVIIYGPNGVGKTRLLEAIDATIKYNPAALTTIPFERLKIEFSDGHSIEVKRVRSDEPELPILRERPVISRRAEAGGPRFRRVDPILDRYEYDYALLYEKSEQARMRVAVSPSDRRLVEFLRSESTWFSVGGRIWQDRTDDERVTLDELRRRYGYLLEEVSNRKDFPTEIKKFLQSVDCHFIETQRLITHAEGTEFRDGPSESRPTVSEHSQALRRLLTQALAANSRFTQTLDRTFPRRILARSTDEKVATEKDIRERYVEQNALREQLSILGLIDSEPELPLPEKELANWEIYVLDTYLEDMDKKLATFRDLLDKISLLSEIVNSRFIRKSISVNVERGITIRKSSSLDDEVPLESLSSGEQHELILFYDLLFNVSENSIVLIDEPEISLHVAWQQRFLADLSRVADAASLRFIIATHSPQLIHKSWHRTVELNAGE